MGDILEWRLNTKQTSCLWTIKNDIFAIPSSSPHLVYRESFDVLEQHLTLQTDTSSGDLWPKAGFNVEVKRLSLRDEYTADRIRGSEEMKS